MDFLESIDDCPLVGSVGWLESSLQKRPHLLGLVVGVYHDLNFGLAHGDDTLTGLETPCIVGVLLSVLILLLVIGKLSLTLARRIFSIEDKISDSCSLECVSHVPTPLSIVLSF